MKKLITAIFKKLDEELVKLVEAARKAGELPNIGRFEFKIVGQVALFLAELPFDLASTVDIDMIHNASFKEASILSNLCLDSGLVMEKDQKLIWMPEKTVYHPLFDGIYVSAKYADPLFVIASKCKFKRKKDKQLIQTYFSAFPDAEGESKKMGVDTKWLYS